MDDHPTTAATGTAPATAAPVHRAGRLPGADGSLFGGYGPVVALAVLILAMALLAPTIAPERDVTTRPAPAAANGAGR